MPATRRTFTPLILIFGLSIAPLCAGAQTSGKAAAAPKTPIFVDPARMDLSLVLPAPPANDSAATHAELAELHRIEQSRTTVDVASARFDEDHEDIFLFNTVLGPGFNADALPLTFAFSKHLRNDVSVINGSLKATFGRPRPYNLDKTLHPVCEVNQENSYPSGHSLNGYVYAFALAQMVPEKHAEILARADAYAHNRLVCEAHYPSDLEASHRVAFAMLGNMLENPRFQAELAAARAETRKALHLPDATK